MKPSIMHSSLGRKQEIRNGHSESQIQWTVSAEGENCQISLFLVFSPGKSQKLHVPDLVSTSYVFKPEIPQILILKGPNKNCSR